MTITICQPGDKLPNGLIVDSVEITRSGVFYLVKKDGFDVMRIPDENLNKNWRGFYGNNQLH